MRRYRPAVKAVVLCVVLASAAPWQGWAQPPRVATDDVSRSDRKDVGPETEKRFPKLVVPAGFEPTLFACDPLVEYPSVIARGPRVGTLFVAHDYVTGLGVDIVRRDEIRFIQDTDGDGYADTSTVYAKEFNSIQGLAFHAGAVYAMHAPLLTSLRDTDGDGVADERRDLITGLGLPPEENSNRLHCANGVVVGHDGWLYLALGDRGCDVQRPEGDRLVFRQGGILRCRPDGRDLHVFCGGLRNIYDIALDEQLDVFVRDNENDGGDYMIRVCHCFHGSDHGYPYHYYERPDEAMPPLADLGRGSSAGGAAYLETQFPPQYRGSLFFCEWGRAVVSYRRQRTGSGFATTTETDFATGAADDPYGLKPTDIVVDYDGSLIASDWADGQRPKRGRGRIYRITYVGEVPRNLSDAKPSTDTSDLNAPQLIECLGSANFQVRVAAQEAIERLGADGVTALQKRLEAGTLSVHARFHAVWILAHVRGVEAIPILVDMAEDDPDANVRAQAVRAVADLTDPILTQHRLDVGPGSLEWAERIAGLAVGEEPRVIREAVIALGRLRWPEAPHWLLRNLSDPDPALAHAAVQTMRRADNWPAVLDLLDQTDSAATNELSMRRLALQALADQADETVVDGLIKRLQADADANRRREYVDALARVHNKPGAWSYWGFRPGPRPANSVGWTRSAVIQQALDHALGDPDHDVRAFALRRMSRENIPIELSTLGRWLENENNPEHVTAILAAIKDRTPVDIRPLVENIVRSARHADKNRLAALSLFSSDLDASDETLLLDLANSIDDGPVLVEVLRELGKRPGIAGDTLLMAKLKSDRPAVRAAAVRSLADRNYQSAAPPITRLLHDPDIRVQHAAAAAAGALRLESAVPRLLVLAKSKDDTLRRVSLESLTELKVPDAVGAAVSALEHPETQLAALAYLQEHGGPEQLVDVVRVAKVSRSTDILQALIRALVKWKERNPQDTTAQNEISRAVVDAQGSCGVIMHWSTLGPILPSRGTEMIGDLTSLQAQDSRRVPPTGRWQTQVGTGRDAHVRLSATQDTTAPDQVGASVWLATSNVSVPEETDVEFLASSSGTLRLWLNGKTIFERHDTGTYQPDADRVDAPLSRGRNRLMVWVSGADTDMRFHVRFRPKSSQAEHERLTRLVLESRGNVQRGRELMHNEEKSLCLKCHQLDQQGNRIGPDLSDIGRRFSRIHLIESILQPSRTLAPSYATVVVVLNDGRVLTGVKLAEGAQSITLGDAEGKTHVVLKSDIEITQVQDRSTMPDGLEKRFTDTELIDLISFLLSQT